MEKIKRKILIKKKLVENEQGDYVFQQDLNDQYLTLCLLQNIKTPGIFRSVNIYDLRWRPVSPFCELNEFNENTGLKGWSQLEEYDFESGEISGRYIDNVSGMTNPDFVVPVTDLEACPLPVFAYRVKGSGVCETDISGYNTGNKYWTTLEEYNVDTGRLTGNEVPNVSGMTNPDYVSPVVDTISCPIPVFLWRGASPSCVIDINGAYSGYQKFDTLEEYIEATNLATGITKPNIDTDPDYVAPVLNTDDCKISTTSINISINGRTALGFPIITSFYIKNTGTILDNVRIGRPDPDWDSPEWNNSLYLGEETSPYLKYIIDPDPNSHSGNYSQDICIIDFNKIHADYPNLTEVQLCCDLFVSDTLGNMSFLGSCKYNNTQISTIVASISANPGTYSEIFNINYNYSTRNITSTHTSNL